MRNRRSILLGILYVLFVAAVAFGQDQSDPNIITVTEKIDVAKLNENMENLTKSVEALTKAVKKLDTTVGELKTTVARIDERTQRVAKLQDVILASIIAPLVVAIIVYIFIQKILNQKNV